MAIRLETLGALRILCDGAEATRLASLPLPCALLVYLALEREADRADLCRFFWPDRDLQDASDRLDDALGELRRSLGDGWLRASDGRLEVSDDLSADALEYCEACRSGDVDRARALYRGPFLARASAAGGYTFAAWSAGWRDWLETQWRAIGGKPPWRGQRLAQRVVERHVVPWTLAYLAGAWVLLEATNFMAGEFRWGVDPIPVMTLVLAFGALSAVTIAWFHGAAGFQRITRPELAIHGLIAMALAGTFLVHPPEGAGTAPGPPAYPLNRIAVFFFEDHSQAGDLGPLSADLTEAVVHRLANVPALDVLPMTAMEQFRSGLPVPLDSIVARLGIGSFVEGSVTRRGDSILTTAQLVETSSNAHLDSWTFTRPGASAFLSDGLAGSVAEEVRARLGSEVERRKIEAGTRVPAALAAYEQAREIAEDEAPAEWRTDTRRAAVLLEDADSVAARAQDLDPSWTAPILLRVSIADDRSRLMGGVGSRDRGMLEQGIAYADRALAVDPEDPSALEWRGRLRYTVAQHSSAEEARELIRLAEADLRAAVRRDTERPYAWWALSRIMRYRGNFEGAYAFAMRAYRSDSFLDLTDEILRALMDNSLDQGRFDDARHWVAEGRRIRPGDQGFIQRRLLILATLPRPAAADIAAAWANVDTLVALGYAERQDEWRAYGQFLTAMALAATGRADSADHVVRRSWPALRHASNRMQAAGYLFDAVVRHRLGQRDSALSLLRHYVGLVPSDAPALATETWFRGLWEDPRYRALHSQPTEAAAVR